MKPEDVKSRLQELAEPLWAFMQEHGVASFLIPSKDDAFDIGITRTPLPDEMHCTLERYGSIYMIGAADHNRELSSW